MGQDIHRPQIPNSVRRFEIAAVTITAVLKLIVMNGLGLKAIFSFGTSLFWIGYLIFRQRKVSGILAYWGFRKENLKVSFLYTTIFALISIILFFIVGYARQTLIINWHILPILILYPIWGMVQQALLLGLFAGNLKDMEPPILKRIPNIILTSILFGLIHFPSPLLMAGTFVLSLFYVPIYLRWRNLWALGLYHGWIGGLFYYFVLNRDPWLELFP